MTVAPRTFHLLAWSMLFVADWRIAGFDVFVDAVAYALWVLAMVRIPRPNARADRLELAALLLLPVGVMELASFRPRQIGPLVDLVVFALTLIAVTLAVGFVIQLARRGAPHLAVRANVRLVLYYLWLLATIALPPATKGATAQVQQAATLLVQAAGLLVLLLLAHLFFLAARHAAASAAPA